MLYVPGGDLNCSASYMYTFSKHMADLHGCDVGKSTLGENAIKSDKGHFCSAYGSRTIFEKSSEHQSLFPKGAESTLRDFE